jgi:hypothetical protein
MTTTTQEVCLSCGKGTKVGTWYVRCSYCGAGEASFTGTEHVHNFGLRCNGMARCSGRDIYGCDATDYDSQWGAGIFSDWPVGHHKPYGA